MTEETPRETMILNPGECAILNSKGQIILLNKQESETLAYAIQTTHEMLTKLLKEQLGDKQ